MQFMLVPENGPSAFQQWESDFRDVAAYLASLRPPRYPFAIDRELAARGAVLFGETCSDCHGTYGDRPSYPNRIIPIEEVGTDGVRLAALTPQNRRAYHHSWFAEFGSHTTNMEPGGYIAPPLDGIWASAPYFHNGSVPTLWHVLESQARPQVWRRQPGAPYDQQRVGIPVETFERLPSSIRRPDVLRTYFNTAKSGKSAKGHTFPDTLTRDEKRAVLEYLKTL